VQLKLKLQKSIFRESNAVSALCNLSQYNI
jgi:hypothetical protein